VTDRSIEVVSLVDIPAREIVAGDSLAPRWDLYEWDCRVNRVERTGADNERVRIHGDTWVAGFGVDDVVTVRRRVTFPRRDLVALIDEESQREGCSGDNLSGDWVVSLLEGRVTS